MYGEIETPRKPVAARIEVTVQRDRDYVSQLPRETVRNWVAVCPVSQGLFLQLAFSVRTRYNRVAKGMGMTDGGRPRVVFREIQQFPQASMWFVVLVASAGMMVVGLVIWLQASSGSASGQGFPLRFLLPISAVVIVGAAMVMRYAKLITEVREDGLYIQFRPFHSSFRRIPLENLKRFAVKTYSPLRDYGGYGIRYGIMGKAYNVSGNKGVNFTFTKGRDILIGSQRPDELAASVEWLQQRHG